MKNIELLDSLSSKQIKAVFFDIDGTLVNRNHEISLPTRHAIAELIKQNITVSLATGRPYFGASAIASDLAVNGLSLFCAGSLIVEPDQGTPVFSQAIEPEVLEILIQKLSQQGLYSDRLLHQSSASIR
jgi:HAD superfamily hydrolase (TIGR01484 family)